MARRASDHNQKKRKVTGRRGKTGQARPKKTEMGGIAGIALFCVGLLTLACLFSSSNGGLLDSARLLIRGLGGMLCVMLPLMLLASGVVLVFFGRSLVSRRTLVCSIVIFILVETGLALMSAKGIQDSLTGSGQEIGLVPFVSEAYNLGKFSAQGGGLIGALPGYPLFRLLNVWGSLVVVAFGILGAVMVMTGLSFTNVGDEAAEKAVGLRERIAQRLAERKALREEEDDFLYHEEDEEEPEEEAPAPARQEPQQAPRGKKPRQPEAVQEAPKAREEESGEPAPETKPAPRPKKKKKAQTVEAPRENPAPPALRPVPAFGEQHDLYIERDNEFYPGENGEQKQPGFTREEAEYAFYHGMNAHPGQDGGTAAEAAAAAGAAAALTGAAVSSYQGRTTLARDAEENWADRALSSERTDWSRAGGSFAADPEPKQENRPWTEPEREAPGPAVQPEPTKPAQEVWRAPQSTLAQDAVDDAGGEKVWTGPEEADLAPPVFASAPEPAETHRRRRERSQIRPAAAAPDTSGTWTPQDGPVTGAPGFQSARNPQEISASESGTVEPSPADPPLGGKTQEPWDREEVPVSDSPETGDLEEASAPWEGEDAGMESGESGASEALQEAGARPESRAPGIITIPMEPVPGAREDRGMVQLRDQRIDAAPLVRPDKPKDQEIPLPPPYTPPPLDMLSTRSAEPDPDQAKRDEEGGAKLIQTLSSFGVNAKLLTCTHGPAITRFELQPAAGVKVSRIVNLVDDIALNMASDGVRIEAPIPGKAAVGIEIPNRKIEMVGLRSVLDTPEMARQKSPTVVALGKGISGGPVLCDLAKMPHMLIAGATGSGKSVCINTIIQSIIYRATPEQVRLILVDPKVVELSVYNGIPHLMIPVVTDPKKASAALAWAVAEMDRRYKRFESMRVRDIAGYNNAIGPDERPMPKLIVIIDELADLMMVAPGEVEDSICRLAQLARAAGIHLVIATQRPSVNVITGVIKANIPSRIAFAVSSQIDSRTILDSSGAEKLLGKGDMLYSPQGMNKPQRVQGCFVTDDEVQNIVEYLTRNHQAQYDNAASKEIETSMETEEHSQEAAQEVDASDRGDELLEKAIDLAVEAGQISISMLQRKLRIGYARAGRLVDDMTERGIAAAAEGTKPRAVQISREEWQRLKENGYA